MTIRGNSTYVFTTRHNSPNKAFLLMKALPPQYNHLLFEQSLVAYMFKAAQEEQPDNDVFPQQLSYFPPAAQLFSPYSIWPPDSQRHISYVATASATKKYHSVNVHLQEAASMFDSLIWLHFLLTLTPKNLWSQKRTVTGWKRKVESHHSHCQYVLALLSPPHLEQEREKTHEGKDRKFWHPKP